MTTFIWAILFILILLLCITIHEFGHFIFALIAKVKVHEFAVGFGPKILQKRIKGILFSLRVLPLGGFTIVAMKGLTEELYPNDVVLPGRYIEDAKWWHRIFFIFGGIIFNLIFAFLFSLFYFAITNGDHYGEFLSRSFLNIIYAILDIFKGNFSKSESIPKAITSLTNSNWGITIFVLIVSININLGIFNLLPIPPLDGWRMVEFTYEKILKKPMPIKLRTIFAMIGITLFISLSIFLIVRDYI